MNPEDNQTRIFYGWYIVGACVIITLYTSGIVNFGFTSVFEPIAEEFRWSYAQISLASSLRGLEAGLLAPLVGFLVDRWGPRKLIFGGSVLICLGFVMLSKVTSLAMFYGAFILVAAGSSTCMGTVLIAATTSWFDQKLGLATGIVTSGFGLGGLMVPVVTVLIDTLEWRLAILIVGLGMIAIVMPLSLIIRHKPEQYGLQPDGKKDSSQDGHKNNVLKAPLSPSQDFKAGDIFKSRAFWQISLSSLCQSFVVGAVITHFMPYLSSHGIARSTSSLIALILPVMSISGRLSSSWLSNLIGKRQLLSVSFLLMTAGQLIFAYVSINAMLLLLPFIITFSLGWGFCVTTRIMLLREYFGRGNFGTILGFFFGVIMVGVLTGPPVAGWVFDTWSSYQGAWLAFSIVTLVGAALVFTLPTVTAKY